MNAGSWFDFTPRNVLLFFLLIVSAAFLIALRRRRSAVAADDACAKCGYLVCGLSGVICPECGADLSSTGAVIRAGSRQPIAHRSLALLPVGIFLPLAILTTPFIASHLPARRSFGEMMELSPKSKAFVDVRFSHDGFGWEPVGVIKMVLDPPSRINAIMEIDPTAARCRYPSTNWKKIETEFDLDAILDMMRTTGIDPGDPNAIADAKEMEQIVRDIAAGKSTVFGPVWSSTHVNRWVTASRPKWYVAATYGAWAIVALIVILRCNRKGPVAR